MSRELPILCAAPVVRAILDGRQTQDRRPVKNPDGWLLANPSAGRIGCYQKAPPHFYAERDLEHPFTPGDVLYVRETWRPYIRSWSSHVEYRAGNQHTDRPVCGPSLGLDASCAAMEWRVTRGGVLDICGRNPDDARWFPSIHMPKWAARIRLRVLSVGVERVNAISEEDAAAEGIRCVGGRYTNGDLTEYRDPVAAFGALWDSLYGAGSFARGDWCWVTRFERVVP